MPEGVEFLMVVAHGTDAEGTWFPSYTQTAQNYSEVKQQLLSIIAAADSVVVQASDAFDRLAFELGLRRQKTEWGNA